MFLSNHSYHRLYAFNTYNLVLQIYLNNGIILNKKIGDYVKQGELLATLHTNKEDYKEVVENVTKAFEFSKEAIEMISNLTHGLIE